MIMTSQPQVTPKTRADGKPIRRRGRWGFVSHPYNGPVWRLDNSDWDLEYDPLERSWFLYRGGSYSTTVDSYLDNAMAWTERKYDQALWTALGGGRL